MRNSVGGPDVRSSWLADAPQPEPADSFQFSDLVVLDLANNHQGSVSHGKRIIDACASFQDTFQLRVAVKFQFRDLDHYIFKLQKKGNSRLAHKIMIKRDFLKQHIQEYRG